MNSHTTRNSFTHDFFVITDHKRKRKKEPESPWRSDRLDYQGEVSTKTAGLTTINLLLNSVVSSIWAKFMRADVKNLYLNTPMEEPEYMKIPVRIVPDEIKVE